MPNLEGVAAEGRSSQRGHVRGMGSMHLVAMLLMLLIFTACRSHRQHVETFAMKQRQEQQLLYRDTLWSQFSLYLENLTWEWPTDSVVGKPQTFFRLKADKAEANFRQQSQSEMQVMERKEDSMRVDRQSRVVNEPSQQVRTGRQRWRWMLLILGLIFIAGAIVYKKCFGRP
jgi:hypothetical protein